MLPTTSTGRRAATRRPWTGSMVPELSNMLDDFFGRPLNSWSAWTPAADLFETEDAFVLEMELPGFDLDDIELTMERGVLTVSGSRSVEDTGETEGRTYHLRERSVDRFSRSYALPRSVNPDDIDASFAEGVLAVTLPKAAEAKPRRIEVKARK